MNIQEIPCTKYNCMRSPLEMRIKQLEKENTELYEALYNIKRHQEILAPVDYKRTGAWHIADKALQGWTPPTEEEIGQC